MFGQSYAAPLLLANAGKSAMKVLVSARPELSEWLTFTPDFGFVQVRKHAKISACSTVPALLCQHVRA
jgi:GTPase involved in cell partitioning and DNA repair